MANVEDKNYFVYDLERKKFWNENCFGYTDDIKNAGMFDYEKARDICKNSNIVQIESVMVHKDDMAKLHLLTKLDGVLEKKDLFDVIKPITEEYHQTNPIGHIIDTLEENGYYLKEDLNPEHIGYDENKKYNLEFFKSNEGLRVNISRLSSGNYEVVANTIKPNLKRKIKP